MVNQQKDGGAQPQKKDDHPIEGQETNQDAKPQVNRRKKHPKDKKDSKEEEEKHTEAVPQADGEHDDDHHDKRRGNRKGKMVYRQKGEAAEGDIPNEAGQNGQSAVKKPEEQKKNLVYASPMDFKETKKYKNKQEEWRHGDWRNATGKTYVTLETVIPPMPEKIAERPNEDNFRKKLHDIEAKI